MLPSTDYTKPNGFSLIELLIAAGLSFLVILSSAYLIEGMLGQDRAMKGAMTADTQLDQADFIVQRYFRSARDVVWVNGPIAANQSLTWSALGTPSGMLLKTFDSDLTANTPAYYAITPLALFFRDTAVVPNTTGTPPNTSVLKATGMYFQQPAPDSYGVLYIDDGSNGNTLAPRTSNVVADHITHLQIGSVTTTVMPVAGSNPLYVRSFQMTIDIRLPLYTNGSGKMTWCGPHQTTIDAACKNSTIPYKDAERVITVILYDNYDPMAQPPDGPALGRIYFPR